MVTIKIVEILLIAFVLIGIASGRIIDKCYLARYLYQHGVEYDELSDWICLTEHESLFNTKAINTANYDGSTDWGLFQINDRYWCKPSDGGESANGCRIACDALLNDDIYEAVSCAKTIMQQQGLTAWVAWNNYCQGEKPSVDECFYDDVYRK